MGYVRLEASVTSLDRDLVLLIQVAEPNQPRLMYEVIVKSVNVHRKPCV